ADEQGDLSNSVLCAPVQAIGRGCPFFVPPRRYGTERQGAMSKRILVTGGAGFVGSNLASNLLADGFDVTIFDALVRAGSQENLGWLRRVSNRLHFVRGDVRDIEAVKDVVAYVDVIFHLAGQVAVTSSVSDPRSDFETNALGTLNVLEAARESGRR